MSGIALKREVYAAMLAHARDCLPEEACGLIAGRLEADGGKTVLKAYTLENTDHSRSHFSMNPREQLAAVKDMRVSGLIPLGNWHSHPDTPSRPSEEDKRLAYDSRASYMILSLAEPNAPVLRSFHIEGAEAREEPLNII